MQHDTLPFARVAAAIEYLYDHFQEQPSLEQLAAQVHVSPHHLQRQFQALAGVSPKKMLQHISIENAKRILAQQGSVQNAALDSGFSGTGRLHDLFVSIEGMTPGDYKRGGAGLRMVHTFAPTAFGDVLVAATDKGIGFLAFADDREAARQDLVAEYPNALHLEGEHPLHAQALAAFDRLGAQNAAAQPAAEHHTTTAGHASPPRSDALRVPLYLRGTPFQLKVWQALLNIPPGRLTSYGELASTLGQPTAARAVGTAIGRNPVALLIPCHRVIRESGVIGEYRWQRGRKMALLGRELGMVA